MTCQPSALLSPSLTHVTYKMSNVVYLPNVQADSELKKGRYTLPQLRNTLREGMILFCLGSHL